MKKSILLYFLLGSINLVVAQSTLSIRLDSNSEDALIDNMASKSSLNYGNSADCAAWTWTIGGVGTTTRSLMKFDLSGIPANSVITSAYLTLKCNTGSAVTQLNSGTNASYIERITSSWTESTVTWNNQPTTVSTNRVSLATSASSTQNYDNIDVTSLITDIYNNQASSYGIMLKLQNEAVYRSMILASGDHGDSTLRPLLVVNYEPAVVCTGQTLVIKPNAAQGKDALIDNMAGVSSTNYATSPDFGAWAWTRSSSLTIARNLVDFDLSSIPAGATINTAYLSLKCNTSSAVTQLHSGANASYLERITSAWSESGVTWDNQPTTTTTNRVLIVASTSSAQNFTNIDITNLVIDARQNPLSSFGYMLKLQNESTYRSLVFASSDHPDSTLWPELYICYTVSAKSLVLTSPNGGEGWVNSGVKNITWNSTNIDSVAILYSANDGATWDTIVSSYPSNGNYVWAVPSTIGDYYRIKVAAVGDTLFDMSDNAFSIHLPPPPSLVLTSPNGGENWANSGTKKITWNSVSVDSVGLFSSSDNGVTWDTIVLSYPSTGSYFWHIPSTVSNTYLVKIITINDTLMDVSDSVFSIYAQIPKTLILVSPNGGENWTNTGTQNITWNSTGVDFVNLYYSPDNGINWNAITTSYPSTGSYIWSVPVNAGNQYLVMVAAVADTLTDISDSVFSINIPCSGQTLMLKPNGTQGKDAIIDNMVGVANVNYGTSEDFGAWAWTRGGDLTIARNLVDFDLSSIPKGAIINKAYLSLRCNTSSAVSQLNSGSNASYIERVTSAWSESGVTWNNQPSTTTANRVAISSTVSPTQDFIYVDITNLVKDSRQNSTTSFGYMLKLQNETKYRSLVFASSDHPDSTLWPELYVCYTIPPNSLTLTSPNGGQHWANSGTQNITWTSVGIDSVALAYSIDSGSNWITLETSYPSSGTYTWALPLTISNKYLVKVMAKNDTLVDISDSVFTIYASIPKTLVLTSPDGGEHWANIGTQRITWSSTGIDTVDLYYSTNNGGSWMSIVSKYPSSGSYTWSLPTEAGNQYRVKVVAHNDTLNDISDSMFTIFIPCIGQSFVLKPNAAQGKDAMVDNMVGMDNVNYGNSLDIGAWAWTRNSNITIARNLIDFDLSTLPAGAIINKAYLTLKCNISSAVTQLHSGDNASYIERITSPWTESGVTWNNQPITTTSNRVSLTSTTTSTDNFVNIDITNLVNDSRQNPLSSFGYMLKLQNETTYRSLVFASSDHADSTLWPELYICYSLPAPTPKALNLSAPNGGQNWVNSGAQVITWTSSGIDSVSLMYSSDSGINWNTIVASYPSTGSYTWSVPSVTSNKYLVKIASVNDTLVDISDSVFTIYAPLSKTLFVTSPNGGENWVNSSGKTITWSSSFIDSVGIIYSIDGGVLWNTIESSVLSTGVYVWNIPTDVYSPTCLIRVFAINDTIFDTSDSLFVISPNTGVAAVSMADVTQLYPNPVADILNIDFGKMYEGTLQLYNMTGALVYKQTLQASKCQVNLAELNIGSGVYFVELSNGQSHVMRKVTVVR